MEQHVLGLGKCVRYDKAVYTSRHRVHRKVNIVVAVCLCCFFRRDVIWNCCDFPAASLMDVNCAVCVTSLWVVWPGFVAQETPRMNLPLACRLGYLTSWFKAALFYGNKVTRFFWIWYVRIWYVCQGTRSQREQESLIIYSLHIVYELVCNILMVLSPVWQKSTDLWGANPVTPVSKDHAACVVLGNVSRNELWPAWRDHALSFTAGPVLQLNVFISVAAIFSLLLVTPGTVN